MFRKLLKAALVVATGCTVFGLIGCTADAAPTAPDQPAGASTEVTPSGLPSEPAASASATSKDEPVAKVGRRGSPAPQPTVTAPPAKLGKSVSYSDGLDLAITSIKFGKETDKGPGAFPGRRYAVLSLRLKNGSAKALNLTGVVVTVLDAKGEPVAPVYAKKASARDFDGKVAPKKSAKAKYAFALEKKSSPGVTVVVDFDGNHTSAVFRGSL